ncbi:metalloreductase transmembrane component, putative [Trichophyton benhamiae CBS 112371]|uniref:ferric-chelate reductase (NADPH) n=1 Tax=Arthroderma benhamiae (strain ATCC MYA-4681 / CBS 112371) TaxID=663331 RepID=D4B024_ARTBC|nr:metalloreductase transmembrane component, putative [Trichophyton benhamiae CBS 112371]EFE31399.1 metalloreductase transmembrane component, putative [Trichophyton benhamiae CBS 112371]
MAHNHGGGATPTGDGVPTYFEMQRMYWAVVGTAIGVATACNILNKIVAAQRSTDTTRTPAKPKSLFFNIYATLTAMTREYSSATLSPLKMGRWELQPSPLGRVSVVLANFIAVMVFCFYKLNTLDKWSWETVGYRTGFMTVAQLPLILLLAGKRNIIGFLTGSSHERLNWLHRWTARTLWMSATIHMGFWFRSWGRFNYIATKVRTDPLTQRGIAAWSILTFILFATLSPVRRWSYELFFVSHVVTYAGFIAAAWLHAEPEVKMWVWVSIALVVFDRVARWAMMVWSNLAIFSRSSSRSNSSSSSSLWANYATFTPLAGNVTRVTIRNPVISWKPGQHVFLSVPALAPFQSHPFTISSLPSDNKIEFLIRAESGATRAILNHAEKWNTAIDSDSTRLVALDGPYGAIRPLRQFDSVVFFAGSMGVTFTMPLLRDIVDGWKGECNGGSIPITKHIHFVWAIRSHSHISWFQKELESLMRDVEDCRATNSKFRPTFEISIYLTSDPHMSATSPSAHGTGLHIQRTPSTASDSSQTTSLSPLVSWEKGVSSKSPVCLRTGRPNIDNIILSTLEVAEGESAVVVCGPSGLSTDVRRNVVSLSDERAVHKGTGAQGIYLHVEEFGF